MTLAEKIASDRKSLGLSQEDLADLSKISLRTIQRIEGGRSIPRGHTLKAIAEALGKPIGEFPVQVDEPRLGATSEEPGKPAAAPSQALNLWLQQLNISAFAFLLLPYLGFLVPLWLWRKRSHGAEARAYGARIVNFQVIWCISLHLGLLLALLMQLTLAYYFKVRLGFLLLGTFFFFYALNTVAILYSSLKLRTTRSVYPIGLYLFG